MTGKNDLPQTLNAALKAGFKHLDALPPELREKILAHDQTLVETLGHVNSPCGQGHSGPCSSLVYPDGTQKVCYCNAANQCDDCVFKP